MLSLTWKIFMRIRLVLTVTEKERILPINYQYEFSAWIYKTLHYGNPEFASWLHENVYREYINKFAGFVFVLTHIMFYLFNISTNLCKINEITFNIKSKY